MAVDKQKRAEWLKEYRKTPKYKNYTKEYMREGKNKTPILKGEPSIYKDVEYLDEYVDLDDDWVEARQELEARSDFIEQGRFRPTIVDVTNLTNGGMRIIYEFTPNEVEVASKVLKSGRYLELLETIEHYDNIYSSNDRLVELSRELIKNAEEIKVVANSAWREASLSNPGFKRDLGTKSAVDL